MGPAKWGYLARIQANGRIGENPMDDGLGVEKETWGWYFFNIISFFVQTTYLPEKGEVWTNLTKETVSFVLFGIF